MRFLLAILVSTSALGAAPARGDVTLSRLASFQSGLFAEGGAEIVAFDAATKRAFVVNAGDVSVDVLDLSTPASPVKVGAIDASSFGASANSVDVANGVLAVAIQADPKDRPRRGRLLSHGRPRPARERRRRRAARHADLHAGRQARAGRERRRAERRLQHRPRGLGERDRSRRRAGERNRANGRLPALHRLGGRAPRRGDPHLRARRERRPGPRARGHHAGRRPRLRDAPGGERTRGGGHPEGQGEAPDPARLQGSCARRERHGREPARPERPRQRVEWRHQHRGLARARHVPARRHRQLSRGRQDVPGDGERGRRARGPDRGRRGQRDRHLRRGGARAQRRDAGATAFPNGSTLRDNAILGRLNVTNQLGDSDGDGDFDRLHSFGARSFSIWAANGKQVFDSGADLESITAALLPAAFNSNHEEQPSKDNRSDNKGPEPEGVALGVIGAHTYAFVGLERIGGVMVFDVTDPSAPSFESYANFRDFTVDVCLRDADDDCVASNPAAGDLGPEGLEFVPAAASPTGPPLLLVGNEISGTTTIWQVNAD